MYVCMYEYTNCQTAANALEQRLHLMLVLLSLSNLLWAMQIILFPVGMQVCHANI